MIRRFMTMAFAVSCGFGRDPGKRDRGSACQNESAMSCGGRESDLALVAKIDHRVGERLRSLLALAFYRVRWLLHSDADVPVFLPGFKTDQLVEVPFVVVPSGTALLWHAPLLSLLFNKRRASTAMAWMFADGHLLQLCFEVHEEEVWHLD